MHACTYMYGITLVDQNDTNVEKSVVERKIER